MNIDPTTYNIDQLSLIILIATTWSLTWKGLGLWKAAQNKSKPWFIAILILNTLGILPIIYILISKSQDNKAKKEIGS